MNININCRQLRLTNAIRTYVEEKVSKANKYLGNILRAQVVLSVEKRSTQAEIVVHTAGHTFRALAQAGDLYAAIDLASDKLDHQLKKFKERRRDLHKGTSAGETYFESIPAQPLVRISVIKQVAMKPMSADEAALEMDRMGFNFWMFHDSDSGQVSVIYRRQDESYGLLLPARK
ncbi:MAG TPA: ribosome-associated translation inhibitor RaiA [Elusimicrobia bacterium]|nr:ribosome-associated translation inhibitor RaiA [Elusimicrobiota bacterium]